MREIVVDNFAGGGDTIGMKVRRGINWTSLLGENCWQWDSAKSLEDGDEYSFYEAVIDGLEYAVRCWARVCDGPKGYDASGDYGVAWIECDLSEYTSREYYGYSDAQEIMYAIDHAETNLLKCGIPFVDGYRFHGKTAYNKARRNKTIRRKLGLNERVKE